MRSEDTFKIIPRAALDTEKWDRLILSDVGGSVYNLSFYLDAVAENWFVICDDDYSAGMALSFKERTGYKNIYQPFFSRYSGLFFRAEPQSGLLTACLQLIPEQYNHFHCALPAGFLPSLPADGRMEEWIYQELNIDKDLAGVRSGYSENARRMIRKASNNHLRVEESDNVDLLISFFQQEKGAEIRDLKASDYERLKTLMKNGLRRGLGKIFTVVNDQGLLAIAYFWYFNGRITYLKGTANAAGRSEGAMYLLFDHVIQTAPSNYSVLDFGGSRVPSIAGFYRKFGATDVTYYSITIGKEPVWVRAAKRLRSILRKK